MKIALVSCGKNKVEQSVKAKDLYVGDLFKKARLHAEARYDDWYILSALHGLVHPEQDCEPYDYTLIGKTKDEIKQWSEKVALSVKENIDKNAEIYIFAGREYRKFLIPLLEDAGYKVEVPLQGLGIGQQLSWYKTKQVTV